MLRDRLRELFEQYDPAIQKIISEVGDIEQQHISMARPRVKGQVDDVVTRVARQRLKRGEAEDYDLFKSEKEDQLTHKVAVE